jgi:hypothetical protein
MTKKLTTMVITLMTLLPFMLSCATPEIEPTTTTEPPIPAHYSTYTSEGLFSISYPPDWVPATSLIEDVTEMVTEWMESVDPELEMEEGANFLFLAGIPFEEGYWPNVNIVVIPRSIGYWTLDEIVEYEYQWNMMYLQDYREYSRTETIVDGKEAIILDTENLDPMLLDIIRFLQLYTVKDEFVWVVTCTYDAEDFQKYKDDFNSIVRSLRILQ